MATAVSRYLPIQEISENFIIRGDGDITAGFDVLLPEVYTLTEKEADYINSSWINLLRLMPNGMTLHQQDYTFIRNYESEFFEFDTIIAKKDKIYYDARPVQNHYTKIYVTFPMNPVVYKTAMASPFVRPLDWVTKKPFKNLDNLKENAERYVETFLNGINSIRGYRAIRQNDGQLLKSVAKYINLNYHDFESGEEKILQPVINSEQYTKVGNKYLQCITIKKECDSLYSLCESDTADARQYGNGVYYNNAINTKNSLIFPITLGLPIDHVVNTKIEIFDMEMMGRYLKSVRSSLGMMAGLGHTDSRNKRDDITEFIEVVSKYQYHPCLTSINVILASEELKKLKNYTDLTEQAISKMHGALGYRENMDNGSIFWCNIPGAGNKNYRNFVSTTAQSVCYLNKETNFLSDTEGHLFTDRMGKPVIVNMWNSPHITNRNKIVIGFSGMGKSYFTNGYIIDNLNEGVHQMVIDIGYSYVDSCQINNGKHFNSAEKKNFRFNIFLCPKDSEDNYIFEDDVFDNDKKGGKIDSIVAVMMVIFWGKNIPGDIEIVIMKDLIRAFYEKVNREKLFPTMKLFWEFMKYFEENIIEKELLTKFDFVEKRKLLQEFATGSYSFLLNSEDPIDIVNEKFIVFDMESVSKSDQKLFNIMSVLIIDLIISKTNQLDGVKKSLVIDEALDFLLDPKMGDFIAYLYRTFRKKNGEVYLAMQNINFFESIPKILKDSIIVNADTRIVFDHSKNPEQYIDLIKNNVITENDLALLKSVRFGSVFIKMGTKPFVVNIDYSRFTEMVYTSKKDENEAINKYFEKYKNKVVAIEHYAADIEEIKRLKKLNQQKA